MLTEQQLRRKHIYLDAETVENVKSLISERKRKGVTQREVSEETGIPQSNIARYERGEICPTLGKYLKLAEYFGWDIRGSVNYIFSHKDKAIQKSQTLRKRKRAGGWNYEELSREVNTTRQAVQGTCNLTRDASARTFGRLMELFEREKRLDQVKRDVMLHS